MYGHAGLKQYIGDIKNSCMKSTPRASQRMKPTKTPRCRDNHSQGLCDLPKRAKVRTITKRERHGKRAEGQKRSGSAREEHCQAETKQQEINAALPRPTRQTVQGDRTRVRTMPSKKTCKRASLWEKALEDVERLEQVVIGCRARVLGPSAKALAMSSGVPIQTACARRSLDG